MLGVQIPASPFMIRDIRNRFYWWRVFIIIVIPILLSIWLFVYPISFDFDRIDKVENINKTTKVLRYPTFYSPTEKAKQFTSNFLSSVLHVPLELNLVHYCFKDKGSFIEYYTVSGSQNDYSNLKWTLNFNNEYNLTIHRNEMRCILINKTKEFIYYWSLDFEWIYKAGFTKGFDFHPDTTSFARKDLIEVSTKSMTLILAWMSIFWMLHGVWKIINKSKYRLK